MADPKKIELLSKIKGTKKKVPMADWKESVVGLFEDTLKKGGIEDPEILGKIARLKARIEIEFRDL